MKKIIATTALLFALALTANAQDAKRPATTAETTTQVAELHKLVKLNESQNEQLSSILEQKNQALEIKDLSDERKKALSQSVESYLRHTLTPEQMEKLEKNTTLFNTLTH